VLGPLHDVQLQSFCQQACARIAVQAQMRKLDAVIAAAGITADDHVLEIGCVGSDWLDAHSDLESLHDLHNATHGQSVHAMLCCVCFDNRLKMEACHDTVSISA
jgi:hypothetical protein